MKISASVWGILGDVVRGTFWPDSIVMEDNMFSKYVPEKFVLK